MSSVVDIKTGKTLFNTATREKIQDGLRPYFRDDATDATRVQAVNTIEQVLCTAIVSSARRAGEVLANKIVGLFTGSVEKPVV